MRVCRGMGRECAVARGCVRVVPGDWWRRLVLGGLPPPGVRDVGCCAGGALCRGWAGWLRRTAGARLLVVCWSPVKCANSSVLPALRAPLCLAGHRLIPSLGVRGAFFALPVDAESAFLSGGGSCGWWIGVSSGFRVLASWLSHFQVGCLHLLQAVGLFGCASAFARRASWRMRRSRSFDPWLVSRCLSVRVRRGGGASGGLPPPLSARAARAPIMVVADLVFLVIVVLLRFFGVSVAPSLCPSQEMERSALVDLS